MKNSIKKAFLGKSFILICSLFAFLLNIENSFSQTFQEGDLFVGLGQGGLIQWRSSTGVLKQTLNATVSGSITGMAFDASGNLYETNGSVYKFNTSGVLQGTFGSGYNSPEDILFDSSGNAYVGSADPNFGNIQKFNSGGTLLDIVSSNEAFLQFDLEADQCTILYITDEDFTSIRSLNACTHTSNADFASGLGGHANAIRIRKNGEVLLANGINILRLSTTGTVLQTYTVPGEDSWFGIGLNPDGTTFWSDNYSTGNVYKIDIATGAVITSFNTGFHVGVNDAAFGLVVFAGNTCNNNHAPSFVSPSPACGSTLSVTAGNKISFTVKASDADAADMVTLIANGLPAAATITPALPVTGNPASTVFSWTPLAEDVGTHVVTFTATDKCTAVQCSYTINVTAAACGSDIAPSFVSPSPTCGTTLSIKNGNTISFTVKASDANATDVVQLTGTGLPATATLTPALPTTGNPVSSVFSWTPTANDIGAHVVSFTAIDKCTEVGCSYTINVIPALDYYSKATGDLHELSTWGVNPDGSGANPSDFGAGKTFHLVNRAPTYTMTGDWKVDGVLDIPAGSQLKINGHTLLISDLIGTGNLYGSLSSNLSVGGQNGGDLPLNFANGGGFLNNFILDRAGPSASATIKTPLSIGRRLTIGVGKLNTGNQLTLLSTVSGHTAWVDQIDGSISGISGNVTVECAIPAHRAWRIMCAPVGGTQSINAAWQEGATTSSPNPNPNPGFGTQITEGSAALGFDHNPLTAMVSVKKYISASDSWVPLTNTNATNVNSNAFLLFVRGDRGIPLGLNTVPPTNTILRATGPLKTGDQTFPVSPSGFTAIPNPYACPINFATITRNNVPDNFYLWDPKLGGTSGVGGYVLLSGNGSGGYDITPASVSPESQFIQSGQGFLVNATASGASIVVKETDKSQGSNPVFRPANTASADVPGSANTSKGLRATLQIVEDDNTTSVLDEAFTSYGPGYSDKVDDMDPVKLPNINENLGIIRDGQSLMIERRQEVTGYDTIYLQLWNTTQRNYLLQFSPVNLSSSTILSAYLEDRYLHTSTPVSLSEVTKVHFTIDANAASANKDRFRVVLAGKGIAPADITSAKSAIRLSPNPVNGNSVSLQFINQPEGAYDINLFNNIGQEVYRGKIMHGGGTAIQTLQLTSRLAKGVYQLHVTNGQGKIASGISVIVN